MGLFDKKSPMEKWRKRNPLAARFVDAKRWDVDPDLGVVHTTIAAKPVTVLISAAGDVGVGVIVEAGRQAERTLRNEIGDDGGDAYQLDGWSGVAAPGSGLVERSANDRVDGEFFDRIVEVANDLVRRIS